MNKYAVCCVKIMQLVDDTSFLCEAREWFAYAGPHFCWAPKFFIYTGLYKYLYTILNLQKTNAKEEAYKWYLIYKLQVKL